MPSIADVIQSVTDVLGFFLNFYQIGMPRFHLWIVERHALLFEYRYNDVLSPRRRIARSTQKDLVLHWGEKNNVIKRDQKPFLPYPKKKHAADYALYALQTSSTSVHTSSTFFKYSRDSGKSQLLCDASSSISI